MLAIMPFIHPAPGDVPRLGQLRLRDRSVALGPHGVEDRRRDLARRPPVGMARPGGGAGRVVADAPVDDPSPGCRSRHAAPMQAFVVEPPRRTAQERVAALDFLGIRHLHRGEYGQAAEIFRQVVELAPSPRFHLQWALAEAEASHYAEADGGATSACWPELPTTRLPGAATRPWHPGSRCGPRPSAGRGRCSGDHRGRSRRQATPPVDRSTETTRGSGFRSK